MTSTRRGRRRRNGSKKIGGLEVKVYHDVSFDTLPSEFDEVMRAISETVERSSSLSLDDRLDRQTLKERLMFSLGAVIEGP